MSERLERSRRSRGGAGLDWLLGEGGGDAAAVVRDLPALSGPPREGERVERILCASIDRSPYQARRVFAEAGLAELAASLDRDGLLQPVVVRPRPGGRWELVAGERRWRAAVRLGWEAVPAVVRDVGDLAAHLLGQTENDARQDVSAWERALGWVALRAHAGQARGSAPSLAELGEMRGGVDKSTVSRYLSVGETYPPEAVAEAGVSEEEMTALSLPVLLRASRGSGARRFEMLRDALRGRRAGEDDGSGGWDGGGGAEEPDTEGPDAAAPPAPATPVAPVGGAGGAAGAASPGAGWTRYFAERGIRVETAGPVREMTPRQAHAAGLRMVPALAAISARAVGDGRPAPLALDGQEGTVIFLPETLEGAQAALAAFRATLGL